MRLPEGKLRKFELLVDSALGQTRLTLKQLQALAGKLNWACSVVRGGRIYLCRLLDAMKPLKKARHNLRMTLRMKSDLLWW